MWQICHCGCYILYQSSHVDEDKAKIVKAVGELLRDIRISRNLTIEQLANMTGLEYSQISRIERGKINTSVVHIILILHTLNVSNKYILRHMSRCVPAGFLKRLVAKEKLIK